jgi:hypothetical protein
MLTDYVGVDVMSIDAAVLAYEISESRAVKHRAGTYDAGLRPAEVLHGKLGQGIDGIRDHNKNGMAVYFFDFVADLLNDLDVAANKVEASLSALLLGTGGYNDKVGIGAFAIIACDNLNRWYEGQAVCKIERFAFSTVLVFINQDNPTG